jgi:phosphatidylglycerophosphatase A
MPSGGARPGAGRPKGSKTVRTAARSTLEKAATEAQSSGEISPETAKMKPLDVLLKAMWLAVQQGNWSAAASFAREASPYVHAKLSSVDLNATVKRDPATMSDDELMGLLAKAKEQPVVVRID